MQVDGYSIERHIHDTVTWDILAATDGSDNLVHPRVDHLVIRPRYIEVWFVDRAFAYVVVHGTAVDSGRSTNATLFGADEQPPWLQDLVRASADHLA